MLYDGFCINLLEYILGAPYFHDDYSNIDDMECSGSLLYSDRCKRERTTRGRGKETEIKSKQKTPKKKKNNNNNEVYIA